MPGNDSTAHRCDGRRAGGPPLGAAARHRDHPRRSHRRMAGKHIHPLLGRLSITAVTPEILDSFYAELRRCRDHCHRPTRGHVCRPLAPATVRKLHHVLSGAYHRAVRWRWMDRSPTTQATPGTAATHHRGGRPHPRRGVGRSRPPIPTWGLRGAIWSPPAVSWSSRPASLLRHRTPRGRSRPAHRGRPARPRRRRHHPGLLRRLGPRSRPPRHRSVRPRNISSPSPAVAARSPTPVPRPGHPRRAQRTGHRRAPPPDRGRCRVPGDG